MTTIKYFLLLLTSLTLIACTQPAQDPKTVADKYWQYLQTDNLKEARKLVSSNSYDALQEQKNRLNSIVQLNNGEATTIISTTITTINPDSNYRHTESFNTVLVLQQGEWKVDINQSQIPPALSANEEKLEQLSDELSESMQDNIESIDEAMNEGMQMLNRALRDGSKEMESSLLLLMNEVNQSMQESIEKMKQRRERQMQEQEDKALQPDPDKGEGMI